MVKIQQSFLQIYILSIFTLLMITSCKEEKSIKGKWSKADKDNFRIEFFAGTDDLIKQNKFLSNMDISKALKKSVVDCIMQKIEANSTVEEAEKDTVLLEKVYEDCFFDVACGKKGAWTLEFKKGLVRDITRDMDKASIAKIKQQISCTVLRFEQQQSPREILLGYSDSLNTVNKSFKASFDKVWEACKTTGTKE